jgi:hypothetical protein
MMKPLTLAAAAALIAGAAFVTPASAVQLPGAPAAEQTKLSETVHYRYNYCRNWRHECARRWGWGSWRFRRCLRRHGC